uniref:Cyclin-dependent kinase 2 homolog n=1 Tax=Corethron hystrix TaxID=216773 RepID=A0A7S1G0N2_9STRA|mmetsp:Transcript_41686/g.97570  ORF Transcript_41686/g.97570 Transcript_41686/m.97570 type:complete len:305 (+) Transcript_41686:120-1034(+)
MSHNHRSVTKTSSLKRPRTKESRDGYSPSNAAPSAYGRCPDVATFEKLDRIGQGTYGTVYRARDRRDGRIVALKRIILHHEESDGFPQTSLREVHVLRSAAGHPNVVRLLDVAVSSSRSGVFLVFEYAEHDLATLVDSCYAAHGRSPFRESETKRLSLQLMSAVNYLHSRHILHRDLKLSNLLYNHRGELKVADFGLARSVPSGSRRRRKTSTLEGSDDESFGQCKALTHKVVSLWYRPPELMLGGLSYDVGVDNWGVGCIISELLIGRPLIRGKTEIDQISKMFALLGPPSKSLWPNTTRLAG